MSWIPSTIVFYAQESLRDAGISLSRGHLFEVFAALHGYRTYAAYTTATATSENGLAVAEIVCFNTEYARQRAATIAATEPVAPTVVDTLYSECETALESVNEKIRVYGAVAEFLEHEQSSSEFQASVMLSESVNSEFSDTNASISDCEVEDIEEVGELPSPDGQWQFVARGKVYGDQDPDRMYWGDTVEFHATASYTVVAGVGLIFDALSVKASVVHEFDPED